MQLCAVLYVYVDVGRGRWDVLMGGGDIEALGEVVLTVGSFTRPHQDSYGGSHVHLDV